MTAAAPALSDRAQPLSYKEYLAQYGAAEEPRTEVLIPGGSYTRGSTEVTTAKGIGGHTGACALTGESGSVEWTVDVPATGLYSIEVAYYPVAGRGSSIERDLLVNGARPFDDAGYLLFPRVWADSMPIRKDIDGNEIGSPQIEKPRWQTVAISDSQGYEAQPFKFFLRRGANRLALVSISEPMAIRSLRLYHVEPAQPYRAVEERARQQGYAPARGLFITLQERDASAKSSPSLYPFLDQGDPTAEPYDPALIRLNAIGGGQWRTPGEWIAWEFDIPSDGLYTIGIKAKQDQVATLYSSRRLTIDGRVPFAELEAIRFSYSSTYRMYALGTEAGGTPFLFPLAKGRHEARLEVVLGDLAEILRGAEDVLYELNTINRRIIVVTSPIPDPLRSYELGTRIPAVIEQMRLQRDRLLELAASLEQRTGQKGGHAAPLRRLAFLLDRMQGDPDLIPGLLGELRDNTASLGAWVNETKSQGLLVDSVTIASPDRPLPVVKAGLGTVLRHEAQAFVASFTHDASRIGSMSEPVKAVTGTIKVWLSSGRAQAQILKGMIEDSFTPKSGIRVDLELVESLVQTVRDKVTQNLLIPAILAGRAPDVALGSANMDLAYRGAAVDLTRFKDFPQVARRFMKSAFVPFRFRDSVYGLPEIQVFPVLFYRQDILDELGLKVPQTWDDVRRIIPELQKSHMEFGISPDMGSFLMLLYQKGVAFYKEDDVATNLDSEGAVTSLNELTELFTLYGLPFAYDAENRFVLGQMPLVIAEYGLYNLLAEFAPELRGQWGFTTVPGTRMSDGTLNRTVSIALSVTPPGDLVPFPGATGAMILEQSRNKDAAWEFLKWWTDADAQTRFGREIESLMGAAARYATANVEAFQRLPWRTEQRRTLLEQWQWTEGMPTVPGSYYVNRQFSWLLRAVLIQNEPVRETIRQYDRLINEEVSRKRAEFGLPTRMEDVDQRWKDAYWSQYAHLDRQEGGRP